MHPEARAYYATPAPSAAQETRSAPGETTDTAPPPEGLGGDAGASDASTAGIAAGDWRGMLADLLPQLQDLGLHREAQSVLEDADASEAGGQAMASRVLWAVEAQES
jgi:hypothetical protein